MTRIRLHHLALVAAAAATVILAARTAMVALPLSAPTPVKVGILHSLTGTMAISERSLVDAERMAIDEINAAGGVLGRPVEAVIADGGSRPDQFAAEAERLITQEGVAAVFGVWTSSSRRTVVPVFEKHDHLLFYPLQYEGLEQSPNVIYLGAAPNQQIIPAVRWAVGNLGRRFVLVGSDYVFPRAANAIIRDHLRRWRGQVIAEVYLPLGSRDVAAAVAEIARLRPDAVLNTLNGDTNVAFFEELRRQGVTPSDVPTLSFSIAEEELRAMDTNLVAGDYAAWTYFQSIRNAGNERFVREFRRRYGDDRVTSDPMEMAYMAPHIWAEAVKTAGTVAPAAVRQVVGNRSFRAPGGMVFVDSNSRHTWKTVRLGRIRADGQFDIVWSSDHPIRPEPYPATRTPQEWNTFLDALRRGWNGAWISPASTVSVFYTDPQDGPRHAGGAR